MEIKDLYTKVADFESRLSSELMSLSQCRKGCSKCCYTDISVFEVEAANIRNWFNTLTDPQKSELHSKWTAPSNEGACPFLHEEACTIYEARPLICRTQGLALSFKEDDQLYADICPLNEKMLDELDHKQFLNLDLLNLILSQLEKNDSPSQNRERVKLSALRISFIEGRE